MLVWIVTLLKERMKSKIEIISFLSHFNIQHHSHAKSKTPKKISGSYTQQTFQVVLSTNKNDDRKDSWVLKLCYFPHEGFSSLEVLSR